MSANWAIEWEAKQAKIEAQMEQFRRAKIEAQMEQFRREESVFSLLDCYRELGDQKALAELKRRGMDWMLQDDGTVEFVTDPAYRDAVVEAGNEQG